MTRENKLALVVGFGLILFVGILISDHFSVVRTQSPADLSTQPHDPLTAAAVNIEPANLIEIRPLPPPPEAVAQNTGEETAGGTTGNLIAYEHSNLHTSVLENAPANNLSQGQPTIAMGPSKSNDANVPAGFVPVEDSHHANPAADAGRVHDVQSGESMFAICKKYYGNADAVDALAKFNKISDPEALRAGRRLRIPTAQELGLASAKTETVIDNPNTSTTPRPSSLRIVPVSSDQASAKLTAQTNPTKKPAQVTYTVKPGETLRVIALKVMGNKSKWNKLYDLNRDVIEDPDNLKVGTVLRIS